jgi:hypothetical protein
MSLWRGCIRQWSLVRERKVSHVHLLGCLGAYIIKDDLKERLHYVDETMRRLSDGAAGVELELSDTTWVEAPTRNLYSFCSFTKRLLNEAEILDQVSRKMHDKASKAVRDTDGDFLDTPLVTGSLILSRFCYID